MKRTTEEIAIELLKYAVSWDPPARVLGNVTAEELARLAAPLITSCPNCGAEAWVNIDCPLCLVVGALGGDS